MPSAIPTPLIDQRSDHITTPLAVRRFAIAAQIITHLEIETATRQIQPLVVTDAAQIVGHLVEHQVIGIQPQAVVVMMLEPVSGLD